MTHDGITLWWPQYLTLTSPFPTQKSSQVETLTHQKWSLGDGRSGDGPSQADIFANGVGIKLPKRQLMLICWWCLLAEVWREITNLNWSWPWQTEFRWLSAIWSSLQALKMGQPLEKLVQFDHIQTPNQEWFRDCGRDGQCGQWWPLFHRCQPRCYNSNIGNRSLPGSNGTKRYKKGRLFLKLAWLGVTSFTNLQNKSTPSLIEIYRDTFCYGPEALCLRASPRSSSEPRLYKNLCNKTRCEHVTWHPPWKLFTAVTPAVTYAMNKSAPYPLLHLTYEGAGICWNQRFRSEFFFKPICVYVYRNMCRLHNASTAKFTAYIYICLYQYICIHVKVYVIIACISLYLSWIKSFFGVNDIVLFELISEVRIPILFFQIQRVLQTAVRMLSPRTQNCW